MRLAVFSHKLCWPSDASPTGYATDGGFPLQMQALSELFDETVLVVPVLARGDRAGEGVLTGRNLQVRPLPPVAGAGLKHKLRVPWWLVRNLPTLAGEARRADAIHAPIPGDIGTFGMLLATVLRKPLFVRYCGNWMVQHTPAERFWKWFMERYAGARNVMLATGGSSEPPSRNPNIRWIFSSSLTAADFNAAPKTFSGTAPRLVLICRQQPRKGTPELIRALPLILEKFPEATLDIGGEGDALPSFRQLAAGMNLAGRVRFHGKLAHRDVLALLRQSTLFCYPTNSEGFPKVVLESLASGVPVVTTPVSVLPQLLSGGGGLLLASKEPETIADTVAQALDPARYRRMSEAAIETARQFSLERWRDTIGRQLREAWGPLA